jgi:hypothetical protein
MITTKEARSKLHKADAARGRRLQLLARDYYVALGCWVEVAPKVAFWMKDKAGKWIALSKRHDYLGLWDLLIVYPDGTRAFAQVTTLNNVAARRQKVLDSGFPVSEHDTILGHESVRMFRILQGPEFLTAKDVIEAPKRAPGGKRGRPKWNATALRGTV